VVLCSGRHVPDGPHNDNQDVCCGVVLPYVLINGAHSGQSSLHKQMNSLSATPAGRRLVRGYHTEFPAGGRRIALILDMRSVKIFMEPQMTTPIQHSRAVNARASLYGLELLREFFPTCLRPCGPQPEV